jgi:hypothetical protein
LQILERRQTGQAGQGDGKVTRIVMAHSAFYRTFLANCW